MPIKPTPLKKGNTIGLIAPSSPLRPGRLETGIPYFESKGLKVKLAPHLQNATRFLAGKDEDRAQDIMDFFADPTIHGIAAAAGGYGSQRLLPYLDFDVIRNNPKIFTGFSDTTALQLGLLSKADLISYSGFTLRDTENNPPDKLVDETYTACLFGESYRIEAGATVKKGRVTAELVGGNLSLLTGLLGTPFFPDFQGKILFFEDVWMEPYQVDRCISQLWLAGVFEQVVGVVMGEFEGCVSKNAMDGRINDVIDEWGGRFGVPCLKDFAYGHVPRRGVLPIGQVVTLDADKHIIEVNM